MAFLYRERGLADAGQMGEVTVEDTKPLLVASIGVRGPYELENYRKHLGRLEAWLVESGQYEAVGEPRVLNYNGPDVPQRLAWSEVQIPVRNTQEGGSEEE